MFFSCGVFLANAPAIYINLKAFVHTMDERNAGQRLCAKWTESFSVGVTIDDVTDEQCRLSLTESGDCNSMSHATSCMFFFASCCTFDLLCSTCGIF